MTRMFTKPRAHEILKSLGLQFSQPAAYKGDQKYRPWSQPRMEKGKRKRVQYRNQKFAKTSDNRGYKYRLSKAAKS